MRHHKFLAFLGSAALAVVSIVTPAHAQVLKAIKDRGVLNCGVSEGLSGFSARDSNGNWGGFDVDMCRAIAAAVFNDASKVKYVPLDANRRFEALQSGDIDVLSRNTTWTISREVDLGLDGHAAKTDFGHSDRHLQCDHAAVQTAEQLNARIPPTVDAHGRRPFVASDLILHSLGSSS